MAKYRRTEMNCKRAYWARSAVATFMTVTGVDREDAICDLLADLMHLCKQYPSSYGDFANNLRRATNHFDPESKGTEV